MIDPAKEEPISVQEAALLIPGKGKGRRANASTVYRAIWPGVGGVCLDSIEMGGRTFTSKEAVARFFVDLTQAKRARREAAAAARRGERPRPTQEQEEHARKAHDDVQALLGSGKRGRPPRKAAQV